ncbi:acylneuraminate cytidylyltransferase family protein [Candidatus Woesearchaeota archaeon]|nr:acylneuraminate cytidylyltransferase family protein [Candidatus Woesearchaeota archaeon]
MNVLAIIPVRKGSKGVPGKNLKLLNGYPLVSYGICSAKNAKLVNKVVVCTDSEEMAQIARDHKVNVFMRPPETATDTAHVELAIQLTIKDQEKKGFKPDVVLLIQCTSPLRLSEDIDNAIKKQLETKCDSIVSVSETPSHFHPYWQKEIVNDQLQSIKMALDHAQETEVDFFEKKKFRNRQELPGKYYWKNGAIYLFTYNTIMNIGNRYGNDCRSIIIPSERLANIDSLEDFEYAEYLLKTNKVKLDFSLDK